MNSLDLEYLNKELGTDFQSISDVDWNDISSDPTLKFSDDFINRFDKLIQWVIVSQHKTLSIDFIKKYEDKLCIPLICTYQKLDNELIEKYAESYLYLILSCQTLTIEQIENLIKKYPSKIDWSSILCCQKLTESFIEKYQDKVNWFSVSKYQVLSEPFIEKYIDKLNLDYISQNQKLSETFIEKYQDKLYWYHISKYQKLSEPFIERFKDKVAWNIVSIYQKLSESFIEKKFIYNYKNLYLLYQNLSDKFIEKHNLTVDKENLWQYKDTEFKKEQLVGTGKYECHEDYFIAYKAVREDRYSLFNFQYQYLPGETYESTCDCTDEENSFGLNVGTYSFAKNYLGYKNGIIIKCKVYYKDIGRIVHNGKKTRCFKITVLE